MVRGKLPMELIADKKSRFRVFRNREKGLKKKLSELSTLCDLQACMIVYGPDGDGPSSSQPEFWPENRTEVECVIEKYMKQRKEDRGKRTLGLSNVLEIRKKSAGLEQPKLQEEIAKTKGLTLEGGVDEFSYEELMEIIGKLDKKLEEVENIIDLKKGKTNSLNEMHCCHMKDLPAIQGVDISVPMDYSGQTLEDGLDEFSLEELMENDGGILDQDGKTNSMNEMHRCHMKDLPAIQGVDISVPMDYSGQTLEDGRDEFSLEELMENDWGILDQDGKTNSMNEMHCCHMKDSPAIQGVDISVPMDYSGQTLEDGLDEFSLEKLMENDWGILDQDDKWFCEEWP
ncbi:hypothetical protein PVL29_002326 [Vitis rotundifolia]|uniref:MADS-box domain-containing protein n=1 Tax=Vitis rotundifolia TaxID=103349 RepID=A0AA39AIY8_VITRO|nr:hypothetical protein PVL29_002326 [Vitis rotundifolia]